MNLTKVNSSQLLSEILYPDLFLPLSFSGKGFFANSENYVNYVTKETEDAHIIKVALPGHSKEAISIFIEEYTLTITAKSEVSSGDSELIRDYVFKFKLPKSCNFAESPIASLENGILTVTLKKASAKKESLRIPVTIA